MRYLHFPIYCRGGSGLSNVVMSWEVGVVASFLLDRVLVVEGNVFPPANIVPYEGRGITNRHQAKVPDLLHVPAPWVEAAHVDYDPESALTLSRERLMNAVFVWPPERDTESEDFRSFARGRGTVIRETPECRVARVVRLCASSDDGHATENLGFYSYFFYLDAPTRRVVDQLLRRMKPQAPYAELAARVSADIGDFNAVHIRRGDFKKTFGTTTRDRKPSEVIERLERSFRRDQTLVILTDERDDPFFDEITAHYSACVFVDHHILDDYREEFFDLPLHDSLALAFLSQLVGADSLDFVGTMTSTYTSLVQRLRGNRGRQERFKFLWNELPEPGHRAEKRGSHPFSDCVPLQPDGSIVETGEGPYSWNRVYERINPAWQREWPESFLSPEEDGDSVSALLAGFQTRLRARRRGRAEEPGEALDEGGVTRVGDSEGETAPVAVTVHLVGGRSVDTALAADSELLRELFVALATGGGGSRPAEPRLFQVPIDDGHSAFSFSSASLVAVETRPPVLVAGSISGVDSARDTVAAPAPPRPSPRETPPAPPEARQARAQAAAAPRPEPAKRREVRRGPPRIHEPAQRRTVSEPLRDFDPLPFVQVTDFLTPLERELLLESALAAEARFHPEPGRPGCAIADGLHGDFAEPVARRLRLLIPHALPRFDLSRAVRAEDLELCAQRDGDALPAEAARDTAAGQDEITCAYFFFRDPKPLSGGEFRLRKGANVHLVEPRNNAVMIYPTSALEEIRPLRCPTRAFEDSRFSIRVRIP